MTISLMEQNTVLLSATLIKSRIRLPVTSPLVNA